MSQADSLFLLYCVITVWLIMLHFEYITKRVARVVREHWERFISQIALLWIFVHIQVTHVQTTHHEF